MLTEDTPFLLLKQKMENIRVARFSAEINSLLRVPNNVVTILDVEEKGYVWFYTYCKKGFLEDSEKTFYAYLDFHQRDTGTRLKIRGVAEIIYDKDESKFVQDTVFDKDLVLIKLKVMQAEYAEEFSSTISWTEKIWKNIYHFVFPNHEKQYDFS